MFEVNLPFCATGYILLIFLLFIVLRRIHGFIWTKDAIDVSGRYVLVTGCDTGFGYDTALELNQKGLYVFAGCLTREGADRLNNDDNFRGEALIMDVCDYENVNKVKNSIEEVVKDNGLWALINNAGINQLGPIEWVTVQQMQKVMEINLWGMVNVTKTMLPLIKKACGRVVNMSSILGRTCTNNLASYSMSKYAIEAFSDCLRYEMKPWCVSVHIIEPGSHSTPFAAGSERQWDGLWKNLPREMQDAYGDYFRKDCVVELVKKAEKISSDPKHVVDAYCHAVGSLRPKLRYVVGTDANTVGLLMATLPTAMADKLRGLLVKPIIPAAMKKNN